MVPAGYVECFLGLESCLGEQEGPLSGLAIYFLQKSRFFLTEASMQRQNDYFMSACHLLWLRYRLGSPEPPHACVRVQCMPLFRFSIFFLHSGEYLQKKLIILKNGFIAIFIYISGCLEKFLGKSYYASFFLLHYKVTKRFSGI